MPEKTPSGVHAISQQSDEYDGDDMCLFFPVLTVSSRPLYSCYTGKRCPCNIYRLVARASDAYLLICDRVLFGRYRLLTFARRHHRSHSIAVFYSFSWGILGASAEHFHN